MWTIIILLGAALYIFICWVFLSELSKIRKALELMAKSKEVHEIIETVLDEDEEVIGERGVEVAEATSSIKEFNKTKVAPPKKRVFRKTKIKVVEVD